MMYKWVGHRWIKVGGWHIRDFEETARETIRRIEKEVAEEIKEQTMKDLTKESKPKDVGFDTVHHPSHYTEGRKYEPKDVIHDWKLSWNLGNAVKYISRAGRKGDAMEDLLKAIEYINYEIEGLLDGSKGK